MDKAVGSLVCNRDMGLDLVRSAHQIIHAHSRNLLKLKVEFGYSREAKRGAYPTKWSNPSTPQNSLIVCLSSFEYPDVIHTWVAHLGILQGTVYKVRTSKSWRSRFQARYEV